MKKILLILVGNIIYDARVSKEIDSLLKFGYKVVLVQTEVIPEKYCPNYKIYTIKKRRTDRMTFSKLYDICKFSTQLKHIIKIEKPDYIHCNDIQALVYALRFINNEKVVYDSHELAAECVSGLMGVISSRVEKFLLPKLHGVIIPQIDRLRYFCFRNPAAKGKVHLLENFPTRFEIDNSDLIKDVLGIDRGSNKVALYTGILNDERKVKEIVNSMVGTENIILVMVGFCTNSYKNELMQIINRNALNEQVYICDPQPHGIIKKLASCADIGICFYEDPNLNSYFCASNKLYELMDSGTLVLTNDTVGASRVVKPENGICIETVTVENIRKGLSYLSTCQNAPRMNYYWESQEEVLKDIYK